MFLSSSCRVPGAGCRVLRCRRYVSRHVAGHGLTVFEGADDPLTTAATALGAPLADGLSDQARVTGSAAVRARASTAMRSGLSASSRR
jgi:hypothetical protein